LKPYSTIYCICNVTVTVTHEENAVVELILFGDN